MSYTTPDQQTSTAKLRRELAAQRGKERVTNDHLRAAYERQANDRLKETVEKERRYMQAQVDAEFERASAVVIQLQAESDHWRQQVEIIYALLEDTTHKAEAQIAELKIEVARLQRELQLATPKAGKRAGMLKEARRLGRSDNL